MVTQWVDDPSWGNIFSKFAENMASAPTEVLQQRQLAEKIKTERANRAAGIATGEAYAKTLPQYGPTTEFNPVAPSVEGGKWSTDPVLDEPANIPQSWTDPAGAQQFSAMRDLYAKTGMQAALAGKTGEIPGLVSYGQVATQGVPEDAARKSQLEFGTTGKFREEKPQNYIAIGPDGTSVKRWTSTDGKTDAFTGEKIAPPPGTQIVMAGASDVNPQPVNPFKDKGSSLMVSNAMNAVGNGARLTPDQARTTALALADMGYSPTTKIQQDAQGNQTAIHGFQEKEFPPAMMPLVQHLNQVLFPQIGAQAAPATTAAPGATMAAPGATPGAAAAAPAAPAAPTSIVPPMTTETLSKAPGSAEQTKEVRAVAQAANARLTLEQLMMYDPTTGQPRSKPYVPSLAAALINERAGGGLLGRYAVGKLDPVAKQYYVAAKQWVEPVLRMASGAAIRDTEYADYYGMFIPEPGDSTQIIQQKLGAMKLWENATANAATSGEALAMMDRAAAGNPMIHQAVDRIRVKANEAGTLNTPLAPLRGGGPSTPQAVPPGAANVAPTTAPPGVDHNAVRQLLGMQ
jgi:hypothetical protein